MKERCEVVRTRMDVGEGGHQPNVNCRVQSFGLIVDKFDERKVRWVKQMGFGGLLYLSGKTLPRGLCYWLMSKVDPVNGVFMGSHSCQYQLGRSQVSWVFGIPHGSRVVPQGARSQRYQSFVDDFCSKYKTDGVGGGEGGEAGGTMYLCMPKVIEVVERDCDEDFEMEFTEAFLALALAYVLCPTTCPRLEKELIPALTVHEAKEYDWCSLVIEKLLFHARRFASNFYKNGYASCVGGCTYFLAVCDFCLFILFFIISFCMVWLT